LTLAKKDVAEKTLLGPLAAGKVRLMLTCPRFRHESENKREHTRNYQDNRREEKLMLDAYEGRGHIHK
jgi:hypothetical protein